MSLAGMVHHNNMNTKEGRSGRMSLSSRSGSGAKNSTSNGRPSGGDMPPILGGRGSTEYDNVVKINLTS